MPPEYFRIKNMAHNRYLVAGYVYDGLIYLEDHHDRLNSIWMKIKVPNSKDLFEFRDLKHGNRLANREGIGPPSGKYTDVAHVFIGDQDKRWQWKLDDLSQFFRLSEQYSGKYLYATGEKYGIKLGTFSNDDNRMDDKWKFELIDLYHLPGFLERLPWPQNNVLTWHVDLRTKPRGVTDSEAKGCIDDAIYKWISLFAKAGTGKALQGANNPDRTSANIIFTWDDMPETNNIDEVAYVASRPKEQTFLHSERQGQVTVIFDRKKSWSENGRPLFDFDLRTIAAHELGHVFGLDHSQDLPGSVMLPVINFGKVIARQGEALGFYDWLTLFARYSDVLFT